MLFEPSRRRTANKIKPRSLNLRLALAASSSSNRTFLSIPHIVKDVDQFSVLRIEKRAQFRSRNCKGTGSSDPLNNGCSVLKRIEERLPRDGVRSKVNTFHLSQE